ncbi:mRNA export factor Sac3 [Metschnikowia bicuspidata var. bicuspidata NRRL YB-4993]|uniref:Nuclear mRNA export factor n=1 Tax=Metschnikowia bicuspidata var. bicuspidata NRRL YB-4993 TaxID=869754 RepID=A0A1A0HF46_9ASCO|nr:mRNA export factor Sac3 [Metschnikowia bicuspidata var. bicuspidata NRRL YB-4993]OBA22508.1 mRNA export factor Sac3 [Metschnikowia bicuspidata var. bicuspidata NRRL YB-4993]
MRHLPKRGKDPVIKYTPEEVAAAGPLFPDPAQYGFMKPQQPAKPRPVPRYMLVQPRLLAAPPFKQLPWEKANQDKMLQMEAANTGSDYLGIYEEFQKMRETERAKMEEMGLVDAENITKDLNDAIFFQGTCLDMCPTFERVRRSLENNVKALEKDPVTQRISRERAVKAFSRPAAGQPPPMPSDVRPPTVLMKTLDYIVDTVLPQLPETHSFIWDRTRSIRQDFIYQNYYGPEAIDCNERIVRIHLLSLHIMAGSDLKYSQQQELEQFNKALQTLTEIYLDVRNHGGQCPNEPEFRAYHLISHFRDPELEREVQTLPDYIFHSPEVQLALRFRMIMSQSNVVERGYVNKIGAVNLFVEFFKLVYNESTPILLACLLETHFNEIRFYALKSMSRSYHTKAKAFLAESLRQMLGFDTLLKLEDFVKYYEIDMLEEHGELHVDLCNKQKLELKYKLNSLNDKPKKSPAYSPQLDYRLRNQAIKSLVNCGHSNADLHMDRAKIDEVLQKIVAQQNSKSAFGALPSTATNQQTQGSSFNLSDFLKSKTASSVSSQNGFGQASTAPKFDFTGNSKAPAQPTPAFVQQKNSDSLIQRIEEKHVQFANSVEHKQTAQSSSLFGASVTNKPQLTSKAFEGSSSAAEKNKNMNVNEFKEKDKTKPEPKNNASENKNVFTFGGASDTMNTSLASNLKPPSALSPPQVKPKFLKDNQLFTRALHSVYTDLVRDIVQTELHKITTQAMQKQIRANERQRLIDVFADELYSAFLAEQTHQAMLESAAKVFYEKNLKRRAIFGLQIVGRNLYKKHEAKRQRRSEVENLSFQTPALKRKASNNWEETSFAKRRISSGLARANTSYEDMNERQTQLQQLWEPIDLAQFVEICSKDVKTRLDTGVVALNCIVIAEDWASSYSKWLNTKLSLSVSEDKSHYINQVESKGLRVAFRSLPKTNFVNEESFRSTPFLIFECGLLEDKQVARYKTLGAKLRRDGGILSKIIQLCDRFSYYKVQILILVWDITSSGTLGEKQSELLQTDKLMKTENCVQNINISDMSAPSADVTGDLQKLLHDMGERFTGQLSKRGVQKRVLHSKLQEAILDTEKPTSSTEEVESASASLRAKEAEILKRARDLQKRRYLSAHATANRNGDLTNLSGVFRTPNGSFANHTLMNYNNTILGNNTFLPARDASFLRSFANASVIEESTPMGSPGPKSRTAHTQNPRAGA